MKDSLRSHRLVVGLLLVLGCLLVSCRSLRPCPLAAASAPPLGAAEIDASLFLIGDAGEAAPAGEPVLRALHQALAAAVGELGGERVLAVFLGDNLYPKGLPAATDPSFERSRRRLDAQIAAIPEPAAPTSRPLAVFVPGNHDWAHDQKDGLQRVRDQQRYLAEHGGGRVGLLPGAGCPGPAVVDVGSRLRLIALDSQWWLRRGRKPEGAAGGCAAGSEAALLEQLRQAIADAGERRVIVGAHHPMVSGGPHGENGSLRSRLGLPQDVRGRRYRQLIAGLEKTFRTAPPLAYAAGHDHDLQVLRGDALPYLLVSGAGSAENLTPVSGLDTTLFCSARSGFVRLDFGVGGRVRLSVHLAEPIGTSREVYAVDLEPPNP